MTEAEITAFVHAYGPSDLERIRFNWNGKHADALEDPNMEFRYAVCKHVVKDFTKASDLLIRDLYTELAKCSKQTWSVYNNFHLFAQELLDRGAAKYLLDYAEGAMQSFDTVLASGRVIVTDEQRGVIGSFIESELLTCSDARKKALLEFARGRFPEKKTNA
jgi:hypothetical protein